MREPRMREPRAGGDRSQSALHLLKTRGWAKSGGFPGPRRERSESGVAGSRCYSLFGFGSWIKASESFWSSRSWALGSIRPDGMRAPLKSHSVLSRGCATAHSKRTTPSGPMTFKPRISISTDLKRACNCGTRSARMRTSPPVVSTVTPSTNSLSLKALVSVPSLDGPM